MASFNDLTPPEGGTISISGGKLSVPEQPIIPFIRGDGTGPDIWAASETVFNAAVEKAYGGSHKLIWFEVFAGQAAKDKYDEWLPEDTLTAFREYLVGNQGAAHYASGWRNSLAQRGVASDSRPLCLSAPCAMV